MKTYKDLVLRAQKILTEHLATPCKTKPEDDLEELAGTILSLIALFDGPEQRAVFAAEENKQLTLNEFQSLATRTLNAPGKQHAFVLPAPSQGGLYADLEEGNFACKVDLIHAIFGMAGEVGEFTDTVKKAMFYGRPLDHANLREEAGDILWYIAGPLCRGLNCTLEDLARENVAKLQKRYPDKFTEAHAVARADKLIEEIKQSGPFETVSDVVLDGEKLKGIRAPRGKALRTDISQAEKNAIRDKYSPQTVDFSDGFYWSNEDRAWMPCPELWELL